MNPMLKRVLGEERGTKGVIPDDAEEHDMTQEVVGKPLAPLTRVVQEPSKPTGEKEKYLTPYSALTAPDCTPDSQQPIDPSKVPGSGSPQKFTVADLENAPELPQNGMGQSDPAMRAMDVLLGHRRTGAPARNGQEMAAAGAVSTEEAEAMVQKMDVATQLMFTPASYVDFVNLCFVIGQGAGRELGQLLDELADSENIPVPEPSSDYSQILQRVVANRDKGTMEPVS